MNGLEYFEIKKDYTVFRPVGSVSLEQASHLVKSAIIKTRENCLHKLLADITGLTGFDSPSISARYSFVQDWSQAAGGVVRVAMVARKEMIDREKFGVIAAGNIGLTGDIFVSEDEALAWLKRP
jgi:hypothetical protein